MIHSNPRMNGFYSLGFRKQGLRVLSAGSFDKAVQFAGEAFDLILTGFPAGAVGPIHQLHGQWPGAAIILSDGQPAGIMQVIATRFGWSALSKALSIKELKRHINALFAKREPPARAQESA